MADLSTDYMGLKLKNPVIVGACGLTSDLNTMLKLEKAGAGAVVCKSLFEEQVQLAEMKFQKALHKDDELHAEMVTIHPQLEYSGAAEHLYWVKKVKEALSIPVIASLNAVTQDVWIDYAGKLAETGVDGLELNFYAAPGREAVPPGDIEQEQIALLKAIRKKVRLPLCVKLSPYYTNTYDFVKKLNAAGADGFVLFNRLFQSDIDIDKEQNIFPFTFSHKEDNRLSLRYAGLLASQIGGTICCSTGITDRDDVVKMLLAGADAVQIVSTLYRNGISYISSLLDGILEWMEKKQYTTINDFRGKLSLEKIGKKDRWIYRRAQYVKILMQSGEELVNQIL